ncbi:MAG: Nramp family divalent metal transporter [Candidatus Omnitrophota bacterium]
MRKWLHRIAVFFAILGPGFITANADNDAGGIATYAITGAQEGYSLLWVLLLITFSLGIVQEMSSRMGIVTGQGLAGLIREKFGVRWTLMAMLLLFFANIFVTIADFSGIAASMEIFGVPRVISIPVFMIFILWLLIQGTYRFVEKVFLFSSLFFFTYVISGFMAKPEFHKIAMGFVPSFKTNTEYLVLVIALIGTTITPWMQFYLQSSIVEKRIKLTHLKYSSAEVYIGAFFTDFVSFFIIIATAATLFKAGIRIDTAEKAAQALRPLVGTYCSLLFAIGLLNASVLAAAILPVSTSYAICEAFGWESGINKKIKDAPMFFSILAFTAIVGGGIVLFPQLNLMKVMLISQTANGILMPFILIFMLRIINDKNIMGKYTNSFTRNVISYLTAAGLITLTVFLLIFSIKDLF